MFNLDLGIETCFYNGMDDYTKMWLQLAFPLYLIIIVISLIIGSRYSSKIQRITAQRALPVLATLFLIIYTKLLVTVCVVFFGLSTITHLSRGHIHTTVVWSVDTKIPLLSLKYSIIIAMCLILLLVLLPFNILLLFSRKLSCFKFVSTLKPLLDAYFGPYKDKYSYWTGMQLAMRGVFFGLSVLDKNVSLISGIIILGILLCIHGIANPFKGKFTNTQESFVLLNLLAVYAITLHKRW